MANQDTAALTNPMATASKPGTGWRRTMKRYLPFYLLFLPPMLYYLIFRYAPVVMALTISFMDYNIYKGILASPWAGFKHFMDFFNSVYFWRVFAKYTCYQLVERGVRFPGADYFRSHA